MKGNDHNSKSNSDKFVILDTNVLLHDPNALLNFENATIIVPLIVIEELDKFKRGMDEIGKAAREVIRYLDRLKGDVKLTDGIPLENGGYLRVYIINRNTPVLPAGLDSKVKDNYILKTALQVKEDHKANVLLVTKDANLRIKADALNLETADYNHSSSTGENLYDGVEEVSLSDQEIDQFYHDKKISLRQNSEKPYYQNQYLFLTAPGKSALAKFHAQEQCARTLDFTINNAWGIFPRNKEQTYSFDALLNPSIPLVTISGSAGTGKTLIAIACGLHQVTETKNYSKLLVARPIIPMGKEMGFLPGEVSEKMRPWMQPIFDNLELILGIEDKETDEERDQRSKLTSKDAINDLIQMKLLQIEPLTYIRGRSIPKQFLIVDEAQNLTPHEVKTIITRAGEGTKIVLTGDPHQIDHPYLNIYSNGLVFAADRFKGQKLAAHITLKKGERSELAELGAQILN